MKDLTMTRMAEAHGTGLAGLAGKISSALDDDAEIKGMLEEASSHLGRTPKEVANLASDLLAGFLNLEDSIRLRKIVF